MLPVDGLELLNLLTNQGHDADPAEDMLSAKALTRYTVGEGLPVLVARLAEVPHEKADVSSETFF